MIRLSAVIITLNEERNLDRCLLSIQHIADEILVVDSGSSDRTVAIAEQYGARIIVQPFLGYVAQKNFASDQASNDWVLSIDADEALSADLEASVREIKQSPVFAVYEMKRLTNYCGKWIRHAGWYPDVKTRLYDRKKGNWQGAQIHEHWEPENAGDRVGRLEGDLLHYSYYSISDHLKQIEKFSEILAGTAVARGKKSNFFKVLFYPKWKFITTYLFQLGFLDGYEGWLIARLSAFATFAKYSKILQYSKLKKSN